MICSNPESLQKISGQDKVGFGHNSYMAFAFFMNHISNSFKDILAPGITASISQSVYVCRCVYICVYMCIYMYA